VVRQHDGKNWKKIAEVAFKSKKTDVQCLHRWQKVLDPKLHKGPWTKEEDEKLKELVDIYGPKKWSVIAQHFPGRIGKQCRERWHNHLNPNISKSPWTKAEDRMIVLLYRQIGSKWAEMSKHLQNAGFHRTDNAIKNHWNSSLKKKFEKDPNAVVSDDDSSDPILPNTDSHSTSQAGSSQGSNKSLLLNQAAAAETGKTNRSSTRNSNKNQTESSAPQRVVPKTANHLGAGQNAIANETVGALAVTITAAVASNGGFGLGLDHQPSEDSALFARRRSARAAAQRAQQHVVRKFGKGEDEDEESGDDADDDSSESDTEEAGNIEDPIAFIPTYGRLADSASDIRTEYPAHTPEIPTLAAELGGQSNAHTPTITLPVDVDAVGLSSALAASASGLHAPVSALGSTTNSPAPPRHPPAHFVPTMSPYRRNPGAPSALTIYHITPGSKKATSPDSMTPTIAPVPNESYVEALLDASPTSTKNNTGMMGNMTLLSSQPRPVVLKGSPIVTHHLGYSTKATVPGHASLSHANAQLASSVAPRLNFQSPGRIADHPLGHHHKSQQSPISRREPDVLLPPSITTLDPASIVRISHQAPSRSSADSSQTTGYLAGRSVSRQLISDHVAGLDGSTSHPAPGTPDLTQQIYTVQTLNTLLGTSTTSSISSTANALLRPRATGFQGRVLQAVSPNSNAALPAPASLSAAPKSRAASLTSEASVAASKRASPASVNSSAEPPSLIGTVEKHVQSTALYHVTLTSKTNAQATTGAVVKQVTTTHSQRQTSSSLDMTMKHSTMTPFMNRSRVGMLDPLSPANNVLGRPGYGSVRALMSEGNVPPSPFSHIHPFPSLSPLPDARLSAPPVNPAPFVANTSQHSAVLNHSAETKPTERGSHVDAEQDGDVSPLLAPATVHESGTGPAGVDTLAEDSFSLDHLESQTPCAMPARPRAHLTSSSVRSTLDLVSPSVDHQAKDGVSSYITQHAHIVVATPAGSTLGVSSSSSASATVQHPSSNVSDMDAPVRVIGNGGGHAMIPSATKPGITHDEGETPIGARRKHASHGNATDVALLKRARRVPVSPVACELSKYAHETSSHDVSFGQSNGDQQLAIHTDDTNSPAECELGIQLLLQSNPAVI